MSDRPHQNPTPDSAQPTLHDMMVEMGAFVGRLGYDMDILCAALRIQPKVWMPLRVMTDEEFDRFESSLSAMNEYPYKYFARHAETGMSEVQSRLIRRDVPQNPSEPIQPWEVDPSILQSMTPDQLD